MNIVLQIPMREYGPLATLAAAANMPIDRYVVPNALSEQQTKQEQSKMEGK